MEIQEFLVSSVLLVKVFTALLLFAFGKLTKSIAKYVALIASLISLGFFLSYLPTLQQGISTPIGLEFLPELGIELSIKIDWLTFPFLLTEEFVTLFAIIYAFGGVKTDERSHFFYGFLLLFSAGMSGTTLANDIFLFYIFWELMLIASSILVLNWGESIKRSAVALKYFIITHLGSLLVLIAFMILYTQSGGDNFSALRESVQDNPETISMISIFFLLGFAIKMAIVPFHIWLPDTHAEAPMPVTIMLAAAMLSMGTYGILRFPMSLLTVQQFSQFSLPLMVFGVVSEFYGSIMALVETNIKRIIAYSSVSQMGYILFGLGTITSLGVMGATLHVIYHAIVKALLFCCVGWIIQAVGQYDINSIRGLKGKMPLLTFCFVIGSLAISGVPVLALFNSEWLIFSGGFQTQFLVLALIEILGSILTVAYIMRLAGALFFIPGNELPINQVHVSIKVSTVALAILTIIAGVFPKPLYDYVANELPLILGGGW